MRRLLLAGLAFVICMTTCLVSASPSQAAPNGRIMDDAVFDASQSMQAGDIQSFLNQFPNSCIKDYSDEFPYDYFNYSGSASVAWIIRRVSDLWGINPRVLLAKLENESNLVTGSGGCATWRYISAMGYNCPDHLSNNPRTTTFRGQQVQTCVGQDADMGVARQITKGAWLLKFAKERSLDNLGWLVPDDGDISYHGKFVAAGMHKRCASCTAIYDDGVFQGVDILTGATASFFNYTPYVNQSVDNIYEGWFGSTITGNCLLNGAAPAAASEVLFHKYVRNFDYPDFSIYSPTSTNCIEAHVWNPGFTSWKSHIASNQVNVLYPDVQLLYGDLDGSGYDYPVLFGVQNTSTGKIESHVWNHEMNNFLAHAASNQAAVDPADCKIIMADLLGQNKDQVVLICERNTSTGKIELHVWNPGMQTWAYHIVTNMPAIDPAQATVVSGDIDGNGQDELILVAYNNTGSSKIEFHVWNPGFYSWRYHIVTNMGEVDPQKAKVEFADLDANRVDEAILVATKATGSGKIEFHVWNPGYYSWQANIASNQPVVP